MLGTGVGEFVFFRIVDQYFSNEIATFGMGLMQRAMKWVSAIALTATTLWTLLVGYRLATGQSRENAMVTITKAARITLIVTIASVVGANGTMLHKTMTDGLDKEIHELFTGQQDSSAAEAIDENLAYTQVAMTAVDAVQVVSDNPEVAQQKARALLFAGLGTASPPMVAGAMLMLYKFTMAFLVGLGPIFILCLAFDATKDLFKRWLFYILGTLFSMSILSVVTGMVLKFMTKVAVAFWATTFILNNPEGLSSQALQQGGIGMLMTLLIITVPTFGAAIWQANLGNFMAFSAFDRGGSAASPGPQGQPAGSYPPPQAQANGSYSPNNNASLPNQTTARVAGAEPSSPSVPAGSLGQAGRNRDLNT